MLSSSQYHKLSRVALVVFILLVCAISAWKWRDTQRKQTIKEHIEAEYPGIETMSELDRAIALRRFAYHTVDFAGAPEVLLDPPGSRYYVRSLPDLYDDFEEDRGGVYCGGTAQFLHLLYNLYDMDSVVLNYGILDNITHVVTLVRVDIDGESRLVIQDPYFNVTYWDNDGKPYDYFELLEVLRNREVEAIHPSPPEDETKDVITVHRIEGAHWCDGPDVKFIEERPDGSYKYEATVTLDKFQVKYEPIFEDCLTDAFGQPAHHAYLILHPFGIYGRNSPLKDEMLTWLEGYPSPEPVSASSTEDPADASETEQPVEEVSVDTTPVKSPAPATAE